MKSFVNIISLILLVFTIPLKAQGGAEEYRLSLISDNALAAFAAQEPAYNAGKTVSSTLRSLQINASLYASSNVLTQKRIMLDTYRFPDVDGDAFFRHSRPALLPDNGEPKEQFYESTLFKALLGGIVVLGGVSAYFKLKADDYYDDYRRTGDQSLLDKTDTYDTISGISFGLLQVNFGFLIYKFLVEE